MSGAVGAKLASICGLLALVMALSGTAYAAGKLARNSVGTPQLKNSAVVTKKIKKNAITSDRIKDQTIGAEDLEPGLLPSGPIIGELPSGQTSRGFISMFAYADADFEVTSNSIAFPFPLPAGLSGSNVHNINPGDPVPAECSGSFGSPGAAPGNLCVFVSTSANVTSNNINGPSSDDSTSRFGFSYFLRSAGAGDYSLKATWAVTSP